MTIKICKETYEEPKYCKNFDHDDEICNCVHQLKKLRDGYVLVEGSTPLDKDITMNWMKREDAIKVGFGVDRFEFQLGVNVDGAGYPEPDYLHMHGNCLTTLIEEKKN